MEISNLLTSTSGVYDITKTTLEDNDKVLSITNKI